jgi:uncharacterized protein (DUF1501 family)
MTDELDEADCGCQEYNEMSRRQFVGGAAVMSAATMFPAWLPKIVLAKSASQRDIIVSVFMRGGADGLSIVAPYGDPAYYTSRTTIAIPRPDASTTTTRGVDLDGFFMFPQAMSSLMPAYAAKDLLLMHATGQTFVSRSHFDAQRFMESGKPNDPNLITGWLGRHLASIPPANPAAPLRGIGISNGLQRAMVAPIGGTGMYPAKALPIADPTNFTIGGTSTTIAARTAFIQQDYASAEEPVHSAALDATNTLALLKSVNFTGYKPANAVTYPTSSFGRALRSLAVLITNNVGIEAAAIDVGGWDTHSAQNPINGSMANTMKDFSTSLAAFYADIISTNANVTLVCNSEFGRNVRENGSNGTDHGRATVMIAMGKGIAGGRVLTKNWIPNMLAKENLESGQDLKVTLDYRDVLAEIVQKRLGNPNLDFIFPSWTPTTLGVTR